VEIEPVARAAESFGPQLATATLALALVGDHRGLDQHPQVPGYGRQRQAKGSASSPTVAGPRASRTRMARRVGSASARKVRSSGLGAGEFMDIILFN
jgi:hypothetical protein